MQLLYSLRELFFQYKYDSKETAKVFNKDKNEIFRQFI